MHDTGTVNSSDEGTTISNFTSSYNPIPARNTDEEFVGAYVYPIKQTPMAPVPLVSGYVAFSVIRFL